MALDDVMTIDAAAKIIGIDKARLRELVKAAGVAIRWGGSDDHPYLKVKLADAKRIVLDRRYVPPAAPKRPPPRRSAAGGGTLHRLVRC